jgi:predicted acyltransferase
MIRKIIIRAIKIFIVALLLRLLPNFDISNIELPGVLQRIAFVFLVSAILFLITNWKTQAIIGAGILVVYWISMQYIPVPGIGTGVLEPGEMAAWIDRLVIPANLMPARGYDTDGFYSSFPAISNAIAGMLTGYFLLTNISKDKKVIHMLITGVMLIIIGHIWGWEFPINKRLWTSSFVLYTSGWALTIFAISFWFTDVLGYQKWSKPFIVFGSNAIAIYVLADIYGTIFKHTHIKEIIYNSILDSSLCPKVASLTWAIFSVTLCYFTALLLYRKKIFIKL